MKSLLRMSCCLPLVSICVCTSAIGEDQYAAAVNNLIDRLENSEKKIDRSNAAGVLGEMGELASSAVPTLIDAAKSEDIGVRIAVYGALGNIRDARGVDALLWALENEIELVGNPVEYALGKIADGRAVALLLKQWSENEDKGMSSVGAVYDMGKPGIDACMEVALGNDAELALRAIRILTHYHHIRDPRFDASLSKLIVHPDPEVRSHAMSQLTPNAAMDNIDTLLLGLADESPGVRSICAGKLVPTKDPRVYDALIAALHDVEPQVRAIVISSLGRLGDVRAYDHIVAALNLEDPYVQHDALSALGHLGDLRAIDHIRPYLETENYHVALTSLLQLRDPSALKVAADGLQNVDEERRNSTGNACYAALQRDKDPSNVPYLREFLEYDLDSRTRMNVEMIIARDEGSKADVNLEDIILDESKPSHEFKPSWSAALKLLGEQAMDVLITGMDSTSFGVRYRCVEAMDRVEDPRAIDAYIKALQDSDERVQREAANGLAKLKDPRAIEPLIAALPPFDFEAGSGPDSSGEKKAIAEALRSFSGRNYMFVRSAWKDWWAEHREEMLGSVQ
ncbi:MAG: HEAT repeat domain-containing protein [Candidatus Hydrogenedentes bacterium]|nr:HEAT repeat domain-containing protein [Candidatus Hydrogenedentota bacterium]